MKTTEMILKVKDAQDYDIVNDRGFTIKTESMRDLGFVLYTIIEQVMEGATWYICEAHNVNFNMPAVLLIACKGDSVGPAAGDSPTFNGAEYTIDVVHPLEFDGFGELENWSHVSEEDATQLLTKAPAEPVPVQIEGVDLFKQVFDALGLNYDEYDASDICYEYVQFLHRTEDRYVDIMFDKGLVQVGHAGNSEPPRRLKITLVPAESNEPSTAPDQRTGAEVKAG